MVVVVELAHGFARLPHTCATSWSLVRPQTRRPPSSATYTPGLRPFATVWVSLLELHEVQLLLGHARLPTTQRYLHASIPTLVEKFRGFT